MCIDDTWATEAHRKDADYAGLFVFNLFFIYYPVNPASQTLTVSAGWPYLSRFSTRRNILRAAKNLLFFIEFPQKRTLKIRIKFNFSDAESLCVPRDQNNSRSVRMIPSSGKPALHALHEQISIFDLEMQAL